MDQKMNQKMNKKMVDLGEKYNNNAIRLVMLIRVIYIMIGPYYINSAVFLSKNESKNEGKNFKKFQKMVDLGEKYNNNGIRLVMLIRVTPIQKYLLPNGTPCLLSRYVYKSSYYPMKPLLF